MKKAPRDVAEFFDAGWETQARKALERAGRSPDLGVDAARDALRVAAGELTEDEFQQRHHEAYLREFGVDERPFETSAVDAPASPASDGEGGGPGSGDAPTDGVDDEHPRGISRRAALRMAGAGAAALLLGEVLRPRAQAAGSAETENEPGAGPASEEAGDRLPVRWGMVIDLERCTGCMACVDACHVENGLSIGVHWMHVFDYADENRDDVNFLVRPCMHCSNAPCVKVCPVAARHVREADGLVLTYYDVCIGCRYCEVACPYGVNYFQWAEPSTYGGAEFSAGERRDIRGRKVIGNPPRGVMGKCTYCPQRVDEPDRRGTAACALACPHDVIHVGDLNDPLSDPRLYLERRRKENPNLSTFRLLDELGTEPNNIYIGQEPSERAEPVQGPTTYEDWGFVSDRRAVLQDSTPWFRQAVRRG